MSYVIKDLLIETSKDDKENPHFTFDNESPVLKNLSKINIFVGSNNSGKSLFLRYLSKIDRYKFSLNNIDFINTQKRNIELFKEQLEAVMNNDRLKVIFRENETTINKELDITKCLIVSNRVNSDDYEIVINSNNEESDLINQKIKNVYSYIKHRFDNNKYRKNYSFKKVYIPTLRGLRNPVLKGIIKDFEEKKISNLDSIRKILKEYSDLYKIRTDSDYFNSFDSLINRKYSSDDNNFSIFTGLNLYEEVKKLLLGNLSQRKKIKDFENFLSKCFFDNEEIVLIPSYGSDVLHIKIGSEKERAIYNLGDGIQSIIVMTFPLFQYQDDENVLVFIEEPELYIHAGLQKTLIKTFLSDEYFKNHQFFLVSHSNHIIDQINESDEISIYSVKKELSNEDGEEKTATFKVDTLGHGNKNALSLLGVTSSSVYLSNCTIWVEGVTDKLYLSKYIEEYINNTENEKYKKCINFKEGLHYSFTYTAGDSIVHFNFEEDNDVEEQNSDKVLVDKLCSRSMVIVDNDNDKNRERKEKLIEILKERFFELKVIEMENLLSIDVIKKTIKSYDSCSKIKDEEFNNVSETIHKTKRLGTLIEDYLLKDLVLTNRKHFKVKDTSKKKTKNLTINDKVGFCKKAISFIKFENMTNYSKEVVEKILDFILENNFKAN